MIKPFGLNIGAEISALVRTLVPINPEPAEGVVKILQRLVAVTLTVGVFNPENKFTALTSSQKNN